MPELGLLYHKVILFLIFNYMLFSKMALPLYSLTNNEKEFQFSTSYPTLFFKNSGYPNAYEVIAYF